MHIGCVSGRLVARLEDRITAVQVVDGMVEVTQEQELDLGHLGKRKLEQVQKFRVPTKRPDTSDQWLRG